MKHSSTYNLGYSPKDTITHNLDYSSAPSHTIRATPQTHLPPTQSRLHHNLGYSNTSIHNLGYSLYIPTYNSSNTPTQSGLFLNHTNTDKTILCHIFSHFSIFYFIDCVFCCSYSMELL